jgi:phospholipid/cholesterol/gamma-HCH transport system permease protein
MDADAAGVETTAEDGRIVVTAYGDWTIRKAGALDARLMAVSAAGAGSVHFDLSGVTAMDTAGAWLIFRTARAFEKTGVDTELSGLSETYRPLLDVVAAAADRAGDRVSVFGNYWVACLERVGRATVEAWDQAAVLLNFLGLTIVTFMSLIRYPRRLRPVSFVNQIEQTGLNAVPIICLLSFLVGIVIAFVGADQLRRFGAEVFTINLLGVMMLREIGTLLTAILVAGRSGSAFTAQLGTMQVNEEVDALRTIGLDPVEVLVLPRIAGMLVTMPILVFLAEVSGLLGGALMTTIVLDFTFTQFIHQLQSVVTLSHFFVGMIKAPVFAFIVAIVGCHQGLQVSGSAESVGRMTTKSVVTAIFLIIVANAIFSTVFSILKI